jgi:hypothetical protein
MSSWNYHGRNCLYVYNTFPERRFDRKQKVIENLQKEIEKIEENLAICENEINSKKK